MATSATQGETISYGDVLLENCTIRVAKKTEYAGHNYLWTRVVLFVEGVFNPKVNGFRWARGNRDESPVKKPVLPPVTEVALRHYLAVPRRQLVWTWGKDVVLSSPQKITGRERGQLTDCNNGPIPDAQSIDIQVGRHTWWVKFAVTTYLNEVPRSLKLRTFPLLAHEWSMSHSVDQDAYTTRTIRGRAVFRADVLQATAKHPDQLRYWLGHPIPRGFARMNVRVDALPDNRTIEYSIVDRERSYSYDPNIVTRMEAIYTKRVATPGMEKLLGDGKRGLIQLGASVAGTLLRTLGDLVHWRGPGAIDWQGMRAERASTDTVLDALSGIPIVSHHVLIRMWGHRNCNRQRLYNEAHRVALLTIGKVDANARRAGGHGRRFTQDLGGSFVELEVWILGSFAGGIIDMFQPPPDLPLNLQDRDTIRLNPNHMRGTYLGACVAQALRDPGDPWAQVGDPDRIFDNPDARRLSLDVRQGWQDFSFDIEG